MASTLIVKFVGEIKEEFKVRDGWRIPGPRADGTLTFQDEEGRDVRINWKNVLQAWVEG